jgi:hypothetical protein
MMALIGVFYFYLISKEWLYLQIFGCSLNLLVFIALFFVPQSPKFLIAKKRYDEARDILKVICEINQSDAK